MITNSNFLVENIERSQQSLPRLFAAVAEAFVSPYRDGRLRRLAAIVVVVFLAGCGDRGFNFSQYPGFAAWYDDNPPSGGLPTDDEEALLRHYKPRFFLPAGHEGPIDFYRDYIAFGRLVDGDGRQISDRVTQDLLNDHKADPAMVFTHRSGTEPVNPIAYGRVARENISWPSCIDAVPLTFLSYHLVFRFSGLPAGVPWWQAVALGGVADLEDWHQLDHYTAVTMALAPFKGQGLQPIAVTFQQHNYQRTYLLSDQDMAGRLALPADDRIEVDIAIRSNELYPHQSSPTRRRAMSFMDPDGARYMVADGKAPWLAADDMTDPAIAIDPTLAFLRPDDAFYTFQGWLGERRSLPGRDGPPGADYNTLPPMKPLVHQMALSYWYEGAEDWLALYDEILGDGRPSKIDPTAFIERMAKDLPAIC